MTNLLLILLLLVGNTLIAEDEYPYFSDLEKQLKFEEKRIYVKEGSGERTILSGGGSTSEMANPLRVLFLDENPQYIAKSNPVNTKIEYWYEFSIKQNNKELTELEFLKIIGLNDKVNEIIDNYKKEYEIYEKNKLEPYKDMLKEYHNTPTLYKEEYIGYWEPGGMKRGWGETQKVLGWTTIFSGALLIPATSGVSVLLTPIGLINIYYGQKKINNTPKKIIEYKEEGEHPGKQPPSPKVKQTLSSEQIISLSESYNRKLYEQISND